MKTYTCTASGNQDPRLSRVCPTRAEASRNLCKVLGWERVVVTEGAVNSEACTRDFLCYPSAEAADAYDEGTTYAPRIVELDRAARLRNALRYDPRVESVAGSVLSAIIDSELANDWTVDADAVVAVVRAAAAEHAAESAHDSKGQPTFRSDS